MDTQLKPGERLIPDDTRTPIHQIQLLRHQFVYEHVKSRLTPNDYVLDLGFGEGYGTSLLADSCREIVGVDVADHVVEYANNKYAKNNCRFVKYDGRTLPFESNTFDIVVSFQVIEHIDDDYAFVAEIHRVLKPGGRLVLTTPNKATRLKPGQKPFNRFHKREYFANELTDVCKTKFANVKVFGVSATDEIHKIEFDRIRRGGVLSFLINLGLRKIIPESLDLALSKFVGNIRGQRTDSDSNQPNRKSFSLSDFRIEKVKVDESLDLFALCIK
jgi:ubiquinone/menaquinone biosynthesis C-methylase UbiE